MDRFVDDYIDIAVAGLDASPRWLQAVVTLLSFVAILPFTMPMFVVGKFLVHEEETV